MQVKKQILDIIKNNSKITEDEIAIMLNTTTDEIKKNIHEMEEKGIITGYSTLIDWEKAGYESVTAYIEVKVTPQRGQGFDKVAERIYQYPQVSACSLMSGGFDLFVVVEGKTMKEVALFVAEKLAPIDGVLSTSTHFVLRKYKADGIIFNGGPKDEREAIVL